MLLWRRRPGPFFEYHAAPRFQVVPRSTRVSGGGLLRGAGILRETRASQGHRVACLARTRHGETTPCAAAAELWKYIKCCLRIYTRVPACEFCPWMFWYNACHGIPPMCVCDCSLVWSHQECAESHFPHGRVRGDRRLQRCGTQNTRCACAHALERRRDSPRTAADSARRRSSWRALRCHSPRTRAAR